MTKILFETSAIFRTKPIHTCTCICFFSHLVIPYFITFSPSLSCSHLTLEVVGISGASTGLMKMSPVKKGSQMAELPSTQNSEPSGVPKSQTTEVFSAEGKSVGKVAVIKVW